MDRQGRGMDCCPHGDDLRLVRASATTPQARVWCEFRKMPLIATFAVSVYGDEGSMLMAAFWCSMMSWLMRSEAPLVAEPGDIERAARVGEFREDPKIQDLYSGGGGMRVRQRIDTIRGYGPHARVRRRIQLKESARSFSLHPTAPYVLRTHSPMT